ncbi:MAG: type III pantothenate kinase [Helicobacteraceae bacterium]|jgi:type III pantothenate kinase|nr:type III pantothenate kinase [Helicobacteraceae bacterium]
MTLCEIGNTHYHFKQNGHIWRQSIDKKLSVELARDESIYVIGVNDAAMKRLMSRYPVIDLEPFVSLDTEYRGLGIDRAVACMAVNDGVIVDAGSAITVDVMQNGLHLGGFIYPGLARFQQMYGQISPKLQKALNFAVDTTRLPQSTVEAISYGVITPLVCAIYVVAHHKNIIFTGGDGGYLARFFDGAVVDQSLIFKGMEKIIKEL